MNKPALYLAYALVFMGLNFSVNSLVHAHGLSMSTAQVTLRQNNHISIRIQTSLKELLAQLQWQGKPTSIMALATVNEKSVQSLSYALKNLFMNMPVKVGSQTMASSQARLPSDKKLLAQLQALVAQVILKNKQHGHENAHDHDRDNYLQVEIDGFIPSGQHSRELNIAFPKELGTIMVSYSKPMVQTLKAGKVATGYRQAL